jgi:GTPase SAR1 family protein
MYDNMDDLPTKLKLVLLGNSNVGKTSLIESFIKNKFRDFYEVRDIDDIAHGFDRFLHPHLQL